MTTDLARLVPDAPSIDGLTFRRLRDGGSRRTDFAALAELITAASLHDGIPWAPSADYLAADLEHDPTSDLRVDMVLAEVQGELVGCAQTGRAMRDDDWVHDLWGFVHPRWRRRGLGRALLHTNIARAREVASGPRPGPPVLRADAEESEVGGQALLRSEGFEPVRWFVLMRRPLDEPVPDVALPDGLRVRPVEPEQHQAIDIAENEAFRDHWGHRETTEADLQARLAQPDLDASLWQVAWDRGEIAGVVQNWIWRTENERLGVRRGWLERVSVRRPWRRRGLARALIARSLIGLRDVGMEDAMLGVDSDNPQGALQLYESLGFAVHSRSASFRRPLDP